MTIVDQYPVAAAQKDFHACIRKNPYEKGSHDWRDYEREYDRLENMCKARMEYEEKLA